MAFADRVDRLRRPEYTGENRCLPCTAVNAIIAVLLSAGLAVALPLQTALALAVGGIVLVGAAAAIYLRGYLVPGTPWLTKTYFPDRVLRHFDHHGSAAAADVDVEPVEVLERAGAVTECEDVDDLCLTDAFRAAWDANVDRLRGSDATREDLADILDLDPDALAFEDHDGAFVALADHEVLDGHPLTGRRRVGQWESEGAFLADMAAARTLDEWDDGWDELPAAARGRVLNGLRVFLEACPTCGGPVAFDEETVESCCRSTEVVVVRCQDCGDRLFEAENPGTGVS